jgi:hypothetical protein
MKGMDGLRLEVIKITPDSIPERLVELRDLLGGPSGPRPDLPYVANFVYQTTAMFLRPETSIHTWEPHQEDRQLILWQGSEMVAELYGMLYKDHAIVAGIHTAIEREGGGTRLMRHFARLAGVRPVHLNASEPALGFYRKLGFRHVPTKTKGHHPLAWPQAKQHAAAELAQD